MIKLDSLYEPKSFYSKIVDSDQQIFFLSSTIGQTP